MGALVGRNPETGRAGNRAACCHSTKLTVEAAAAGGGAGADISRRASSDVACFWRPPGQRGEAGGLVERVPGALTGEQVAKVLQSGGDILTPKENAPRLAVPFFHQAWRKKKDGALHRLRKKRNQFASNQFAEAPALTRRDRRKIMQQLVEAVEDFELVYGAFSDAKDAGKFDILLDPQQPDR